MAKRLLLVLGCVVAALAAAWHVRPADGHADQGTRGTFLLVHTPLLECAAGAWASYRESDGWTVVLEPIDTSTPEPRRRGAIANRIADRAGEHRDRGDRGAFVVMLLGDADALPPYRRAQTDPLLQDARDPSYATDHPYQLLDRDDLPDVALGRVPARSEAEALTCLEKVRRYERSAPPGPWRRRINYAAGEGRFGSGLDGLLELLFRGMLAGVVPDRYDPTMTYAKIGSAFCPPPDRLTDVMLERLSEGALLFNYVGHGSAVGLDRLVLPDGERTLLEIDDLQRLPDAEARLPIALLTCCSAGWFDLPASRRSLAEAMLLHPGGPVAVIAGSRPTHPYANAVLQKDVTALLLRHRVETVGALDLLATRAMLRRDASDRPIDLIATPIALTGGWSTSLQGLRSMHARLYNLLGDPATRIAHPAAEIDELVLEGASVRGTCDLLQAGTVEVTVERDPLAPATPSSIEVDAATAYERSNDRVLYRVQARVDSGRFEVDLPQPLPQEAVLIKAYAVGVTENGVPTDAFGAVRLPPQVRASS